MRTQTTNDLFFASTCFREDYTESLIRSELRERTSILLLLGKVKEASHSLTSTYILTTP